MLTFFTIKSSSAAAPLPPQQAISSHQHGSAVAQHGFSQEENEGSERRPFCTIKSDNTLPFSIK